MRKAPDEQEFYAGKDLHTTIVFTHSETLLEKIDPRFYTEEGGPQDTIFHNEKKVLNRVITNGLIFFVKQTLNHPKVQKKIFEDAPKQLERPTTSVSVMAKSTV